MPVSVARLRFSLSRLRSVSLIRRLSVVLSASVSGTRPLVNDSVSLGKAERSLWRVSNEPSADEGITCSSK